MTQVPGDSRVFELLSYLLKTDNNAYILGHDSPNPGTLFFEVRRRVYALTFGHAYASHRCSSEALVSSNSIAPFVVEFLQWLPG